MKTRNPKGFQTLKDAETMQINGGGIVELVESAVQAVRSFMEFISGRPQV